jgi:hypothetical protein
MNLRLLFGAALVASTLVGTALSAPARADDALGGYLERLRLTRLLVTHLENELAAATLPDDRTRLVERLAEVYPELLERETDAARRDALVERSAAFLKRESPKQADPLRLSLLRARYRAASRVAEDHRAALAKEEAVADARTALDAIEREASELRGRFEGRVRELERRTERVEGLDGERLQERADRARGELAEAHSLEGWSLYYRSLLSEDRRLSDEAQTHFAKILDAGREFPNPADVSLDLRSNDFFANAILGMALARSRTQSYANALEWLRLLDVSQVNESIRRQLPAWQIVIALERGEWTVARELVRSVRPDAPAAWLRIAAVGALRTGGGQPQAQAVASEAIALLAARRELSQIADLARQFGDGAIGARGFASRYVRGVLAYEQARQARAEGKAEVATRTFEEAARELEAALIEPDAGEFAAAVAACRTMAGWARFERGEYALAKALFSQALEAKDARDEEAEWMALVCVEKMLASASSPASSGEAAALEAELRERVDRFIARHPASERAPQAILRRTSLTGEPRREDLERLLAGDDATRRQAMPGMYRLFRNASGEERGEIGRRFIDVLRGLPPAPNGARPFASLPGGDLTLTRQALEIALAPEVANGDFALAALGAVDRLIADGTIGDSSIVAEIGVRRVQLALANGNLSDANARLGELAAAAQDAPDENARRALDLARRHVFRFVAAGLRGEGLRDGERAELADAAVEVGEAILATAIAARGTLNDALSDSATESIALTTVAAMIERADSDDGGERGRRALELADVLLGRAPRDPQRLELAAQAAVAAERKERAIELLRQIVSGSAERSERWFRAKVTLIELLATVDSQKAVTLLAQHRQLYPDLGPEPWRSRLMEVEQALGISRESEAPDPSAPTSPADVSGGGGA